MDGQRFDAFTKGFAAGASRRTVIKGLTGGVVAGVAALLGRTEADAQKITQAYCGNQVCAGAPGVCRDGCVCCEFGNGNSRCMPPKDCNRSGGAIACTLGQNGDYCEANEECCSGVCQWFECVATVGGTCEANQDSCSGTIFTCGNGVCACFQTPAGDPLCGVGVDCASDCDYCESNGWVCARGGDACCPLGDIACIVPCPPVGCFTGATHITLADGSAKPIAQIAIGDRVLGQTGINTVFGVATPKLGDRPLYALNGSAFFVTASHPFLTEDGWKSIDPAATAIEHPGLPVTRLTIGDRLLVRVPVGARALALAGGAGNGEGAGAPQLDAVLLQSIVGVPADPATQLYNLRVDGDHTYFAGDLLVHNK